MNMKDFEETFGKEEAEKIRNQRVTTIQTGMNEVTYIEELLMKIGMAESVASQLDTYTQMIEENPGAVGCGPSDWAITGMLSALEDVRTALCTLGFGHGRTSVVAPA